MERRSLSKDLIVAAAVDLAARKDHDKLTGGLLGNALGVDRSAIWRHFRDQDALIRAVGDRLLEMAMESVPDGLPPAERMPVLARAVVGVFVSHPMIGAVIAGRTTQGPGEMAMVEFTLAALAESGLPGDEVPRLQRAFADVILGYAGLRAGQELLPEAVRQRDREAWFGSYAAAPAAEYPAIAQNVSALGGVTDDEVLESILASLTSAARQIIDGHAGGTRSD